MDLPRPRPEPHRHRSPPVPRVLRLDVGGGGMSYQTCTALIDLVDAWFAEHDEMDRARYLALVDEARAVTA